MRDVGGGQLSQLHCEVSQLSSIAVVEHRSCGIKKAPWCYARGLWIALLVKAYSPSTVSLDSMSSMLVSMLAAPSTLYLSALGTGWLVL